MGIKVSFPRGSPTAQVSLYWEGPAAAELYVLRDFVFCRKRLQRSLQPNIHFQIPENEAQCGEKTCSELLSKNGTGGLPWWFSGKESSSQCRRCGFNPWSGEDPTGCRATKPMRHQCWVCALQPGSHNYWVHMLQLLKPMCLEPLLHNKRSHWSKKPSHCIEE